MPADPTGHLIAIYQDAYREILERLATKEAKGNVTGYERRRLRRRCGGELDADYGRALAVRYDWLCATYEPSEAWCSETEADYARNLARLCALVGLVDEEAA